MADDVKTLHHMLTAWSAYAVPAVIPPQLLRSLGDYLVSFLKSAEGERFLRSMGYARTEADARRE
jgi:hypothetical protein